MRSGSSDNRYAAAESCACLSGPPVRRTLSSGTRWARRRSAVVGVAGSAFATGRPDPRDPTIAPAAVAADAFKKSRLFVIETPISRSGQILSDLVVVTRTTTTSDQVRPDPIRFQLSPSRAK